MAYKPVYETREFRLILPKSETFLNQSKELAGQSSEVTAEDRTKGGASGDSIAMLSRAATESPHAPEAWKVREWASQAHAEAVMAYIEPFRRSRYRDAAEQARERVERGQMVPRFTVEWRNGELDESGCKRQMAERSQRGAMPFVA